MKRFQPNCFQFSADGQQLRVYSASLDKLRLAYQHRVPNKWTALAGCRESGAQRADVSERGWLCIATLVASTAHLLQSGNKIIISADAEEKRNKKMQRSCCELGLARARVTHARSRTLRIAAGWQGEAIHPRSHPAHIPANNSNHNGTTKVCAHGAAAASKQKTDALSAPTDAKRIKSARRRSQKAAAASWHNVHA